MRLQVQQQRLKVEEESRKQHQYHSQRQPRDNQLRPISNFYEYESIQTVLNSRTRTTAVPNPQAAYHAPPPPYQDTNSNNSLPRQQPVQGRNVTRQQYQNNHQHRGPFVTQVTIGEHQQNGTKV